MHSTYSNPIADARYECGLSLQRLGKRVGLSRQYLSRAEQGTYSGLNKDLIRFTSEQLQISSREVLRRYEAFQVMTRRRTASNLRPATLTRPVGANGELSTDAGWKIFETWRSSYWPSATAFSNALCVHPEVVRNYEDGQMPGMPEPVRLALLSVGLLDAKWSEHAPNTKALSGPVSL
jgi:hypothetical protein